MFFDLLRSEGYVDRLRHDVTRVVERLGWMQLTDTPALEWRLNGEIAKARGQIAQAKAEVEQTKHELAATQEQMAVSLAATTRLNELQAQLDVVLASTSWRLTSPLRAASRAIRRKGRGASRRPPS